MMGLVKRARGAAIAWALVSSAASAQSGAPVAPDILITTPPPGPTPATPQTAPASAPATAPAPAAAPSPPPSIIVAPPPAQPAPAAATAAAQPAPAPAPPVAAPAPAAEPHVIEAAFRGGVSVATIQVDGSAATSGLLGGSLAYRHGMLYAGLLMDGDPSIDNSPVSGGFESRSGFHLGAFVGPSFEFGRDFRFDLCAEVGVHQLSDSVETETTTYSTTATLPYFGVRPAVSVQFGGARFAGAVGLALFWRLDVGQKQPDGLPDDGGHQLGAELTLALRIALLSGS